jgi:signal transduction histidine kinase
MTLLGAEAPFVLATALGLCVFAVYCLQTWRRLARASANEAVARLEAEARRREAERAVAVRTAFFAAVGHDLRTPLSAILTGGIELERTAATGAARSHAALISQAGLLMKALLDDLLDHAKLDAGRMSIVAEDFNFRTALAQTLRLWQGPAAAKGLRLRLEGAHDAPAATRPACARFSTTCCPMRSSSRPPGPSRCGSGPGSTSRGVMPWCWRSKTPVPA